MKPNIIIITTDQQRKDSLGCYGSSFVRTPNIDRLAGSGVVFERAYCANPVCTPSRATIHGGRYLCRHGAWNVGMNVPEDEIFISHRMKERGYRTHLIGKAHFNAFGGSYGQSVESIADWKKRYPGFQGPYYGFDTMEIAMGHTSYGVTGHYGAQVAARYGEAFAASLEVRRKSSRIFGGEAYEWDLPMEIGNSIWTAERTVKFLEDAAGKDQPFVLSVGFQDPHHPHVLPSEFALSIDPSNIPLPHYTEGELDDKPEHFRLAREGRLAKSRYRGEYPVAGQGDMRQEQNYVDVPEEDARLGRAHYYGLVELIDRGMGMILDALDRLGLADNTIVVFTTDHGELLGDHGLWMKGPFHYEQLINVPLIIRWPGHFPAGLRTGAIASLADIVPTILSQCGMEVPAELDGVDLSDCIAGSGAPARDHALVESTDDPKRLRLKTIITDRYKLTRYYGEDFGELYDLKNDPWEETNLWDAERMKDVKIGLLLRLFDDFERMERRAHRYCYA